MSQALKYTPSERLYVNSFFFWNIFSVSNCSRYTSKIKLTQNNNSAEGSELGEISFYNWYYSAHALAGLVNSSAQVYPNTFFINAKETNCSIKF